jgi:hypothetical protein
VSVIAAANDLTFLPGPLRSRFEIIEVPMPRREHMAAVVRATVTEKREKEGLSPWLVPDLDSIEVAEIIRAIGANPRRIALATRCWLNRKAVHDTDRAMR